MKNKNILMALAALIIVIGGVLIFNFTNNKEVTEEEVIIKNDNVPSENTESNWTFYSSSTFGITFEHPNDWIIEGPDGGFNPTALNRTEVRTYPNEVDPTRVHVFTTDVSLEDALKAQIYNSSVIDLTMTEIQPVLISGVSGKQRIQYYKNNDCTQILTLLEKEGRTYGSHIVQCPTHLKSSDQEKVRVADSIKINDQVIINSSTSKEIVISYEGLPETAIDLDGYLFKAESSGSSPLTFDFSLYGNFSLFTEEAEHNEPPALIDFGDNTEHGFAGKMVCPGIGCYYKETHTYTKIGTYKATLYTLNGTGERINLEAITVAVK